MKQGRPDSVGVLIITKNEATNLRGCLASCKGFSEIMVIDSFSTDETLAIAREYTNRIFQRKFTTHPDQRLFGVEKMDSQWVFIVDADERVTPELEREVRAFSQQVDFDALDIPRKNFLRGKWVAHSGWFPDYQTRLLRISKMLPAYEPVHGRFSTSGSHHVLAANSPACLLHYPYKNLTQYIAKVNDFTSLDAIFHSKENSFKIGRLAIFTRSLGMFTQTLFHHRGLRDGMRGFIVAGINFMYSFMLMIKVWEIQDAQTEKD